MHLESLYQALRSTLPMSIQSVHFLAVCIVFDYCLGLRVQSVEARSTPIEVPHRQDEDSVRDLRAQGKISAFSPRDTVKGKSCFDKKPLSDTSTTHASQTFLLDGILVCMVLVLRKSKVRHVSCTRVYSSTTQGFTTEILFDATRVLCSCTVSASQTYIRTSKPVRVEADFPLEYSIVFAGTPPQERSDVRRWACPVDR